jgi:hypothetical protein
MEITWRAEADVESELRTLLIQRDGRVIAQVPEQPRGRFGRPLFQGLSYHDTPETPLPEMRFHDTMADTELGHRYQVIAIHGAGLKSPASVFATAP